MRFAHSKSTFLYSTQLNEAHRFVGRTLCQSLGFSPIIVAQMSLIKAILLSTHLPDMDKQ